MKDEYIIESKLRIAINDFSSLFDKNIQYMPLEKAKLT